MRRQACIKAGERLEFKKSPSADDEYPPRQRCAVDRALAEGMDDIEKGRLHGPFETHEAMIEFLRRQLG
jgi:hypothetical protein